MPDDIYTSERERLINEARLEAERQARVTEDAKGAASIYNQIVEARGTEPSRGHLTDSAVGLTRAVPGLFEETFDLMASIDEWSVTTFGALDLNPFDGGDLPWYQSFGYISPQKMRDAQAAGYEYHSPIRTPEEGLRLIKELIPEPERGSGQTVEVIGKFIGGFFTGKKTLQGLNLLQGGGRVTVATNALVAGAYSDLAAFDGHEARLADMLEQIPDDSNWALFKGSVTEYLASNENDSELEGRMKNVLEGAGMGLLFEGLIRSLRAMRGKRALDEAIEAEARADSIVTTLKEVPEQVDEVVDEVDALATRPRADDVARAADEGDEAVRITPEEAEAARGHSIRSTVELPPEAVQVFRKAVLEGDDEAAERVLKDFNETNIDWQRIENADEVADLLRLTQDVFADTIDEVKGGVQTNVQTARLANQVGATAEEVSRLFDDVRGNGGISARFYAAQRIMLASADELRRLANIAKSTGENADIARVMHQMQVHAALQAEVKGAQTEIARALQAMNMLKQSAAEGFREFDELRRQFGDQGGSSTRRFNSLMDDILDSANIEELNAKVRWTTGRRVKEVITEYVINAMLSSPKTHVINMTSNALNTLLYSADRALGGAWRFLTAGDRQAIRVARLDIVSKYHSLAEAWRLARQAWADGAPVSDKRQRVEFLNRRAISSTREDWWGKAINWLGTVVRVPGRALITGDEFFKAITRNSEIQVLAFKKADDEAIASGLQYGTDKYEAFIKRRTAELTDPNMATHEARQIRTEAIEKSRLATFQESPRTEFGARAEAFVNSSRLFKLVFAPFFRTPMNILRQGLLDRTPLGFILKDTQDAFRRGTPGERAEILARMTTGVSAMAAFYAATGPDSGMEIVGRQPYDSSARAANVKDYSIRIGDEWYQFNRLDPLGMWLGLVADAKTHMEHNPDDEAALAPAQAAIAAFMNNVINKTWARSLAEMMEMAEGVDTNKPATVERALNRFAAGEFGKFVPQLFKSTTSAFIEDPTASEAWSFMDNLARQVPAFSQDLPRRHDALGREIPISDGIVPIFNPFATSETRDSKVDEEFFRLGFTIRPMRKTLGQGAVELTVEEYAMLTGPLMRQTRIEERLEALVTSDSWETLTDARQIALLKEQIEQARQQARALLLAQPGVAQKVTQAQIDAAFLLTGTDD